MSGLRFKVGELAIVLWSKWPGISGSICEIVSVGPFRKGHVFPDGEKSSADRDYEILIPGVWGGKTGTISDNKLGKISPPDESVSLTRTTEEEQPA